MSTVDAVADLTRILAAHLADALGALDGARVTTLPLDKAQPAEGQNRLNVFLSHVATNPALNNLPMPGTHPGADGPAPLAITLHYIVTFLGKDDLEEQGRAAHLMLGAVMRHLLDEPQIRRDRIRDLFPGSLIDRQVDLIRLCSRPLTLDEISRLWPAFQTPYRLSMALEASCLLIEGADVRPTPMPVLRRGETDSGPVVVPGTTFPVIERLVVGPPDTPLPAVRIGDTVAVFGKRLRSAFGQEAVLRVRDTNGDVIHDVPTQTGPRGSLTAQILATYPGVPAPPSWRAGPLTMQVVIREPGEQEQVSNQVVIGLAPSITALGVKPPGTTIGDDRPIEVDANDADSVVLSLTVAPPAYPRQAIAAWWGSEELGLATTVGAAPVQLLEFGVARPSDLPLGSRSAPAPIRLRIDRVDSVPIPSVTTTEAGAGFDVDPDTMVAIRWS